MLEIENFGAVRELRLARPPVNALNIVLLDQLSEQIGQARIDGVTALVLSGSPGMFSAGIDVPELLQADRDQAREVWRALLGCCRVIAASEIPVIAAMTGHSPAGGTVLVLFCDYRLMAEGEYKLGLNEVEVGLPVPPFILGAYRYLLGPHRASWLAMRGQMVGPAEALRIGLVDELLPLAEVVPRALALGQEITTLAPIAAGLTRQRARAGLVALFDEAEGEVETLTEAWLGAETQTRMRALMARLAQR